MSSNPCYKEVPVQELASFIKEVLLSFLSQASPKYGLFYCSDEQFDTVKFEYHSPPAPSVNLSMIYKINFDFDKFLSIYYQYDQGDAIIINDDNIIFRKEAFKRYSSEEFHEDYFALSTVQDDCVLFCLHLVSLLKDIKLGISCIMLDVKWITYYYKILKENGVL